MCESHALRQLFIYILQIGNFLNFGTEGVQTTSVGGFSLNSLVKLSQTKAFVGGITFLHYVVQSIEVCPSVCVSVVAPCARTDAVALPYLTRDLHSATSRSSRGSTTRSA